MPQLRRDMCSQWDGDKSGTEARMTLVNGADLGGSREGKGRGIRQNNIE